MVDMYLLTNRSSQNRLIRHDFPDAAGPIDMSFMRMGFATLAGSALPEFRRGAGGCRREDDISVYSTTRTGSLGSYAAPTAGRVLHELFTRAFTIAFASDYLEKNKFLV